MESVWTKAKDAVDGPIIGIDFGTSNSCVAVWHPGKKRAKVVKTQGRETTPSTLQFIDLKSSQENFVVGSTATNAAVPILSGIKSFLGGVDGDKGSKILCTDQKGITQYMDTEVLVSHILSHLKQSAETYLTAKRLDITASENCITTSSAYVSVSGVVIGVPANFTESKKRCLRRAAGLAGFKNIFLMIESTAAAMAYGLLVAGTKTVLIFDMGGGSTDVTIMSIVEGKFTVKVTHGHNKCGGQDLDAVMVSLLLKKLCADSDVHCEALRDSLMTDVAKYGYILQQCREAKETLTEKSVASIHLPRDLLVQYGVQTNNEITISREEFDSSASAVCHVASRVAQKALEVYRSDCEKAGEPYPIDEVVLIGGSSRVPLVQSSLRSVLGDQGFLEFSSSARGVGVGAGAGAGAGAGVGGKEFCCSVNPDLAVAQGLAIRGGVLMNHSVGLMKDILMMDVMHSSIGVLSWSDGSGRDEVGGGGGSGSEMERYFTPVLCKGVKIPVVSRKIFRVSSCTPTLVSLDVYEECEKEEEFDVELNTPSSSSSSSSSPHHLSTGPEYTYTLIGTYDFPVPVDTSKLTDLHCEASRLNRCDKVAVCFGIDEDGLLTFDVEAESKDDAERGRERGGVADSSNADLTGTMKMLVAYCAVLLLLYLWSKQYLRDEITTPKESVAEL